MPIPRWSRELSVTSANINDGGAGPEALPDNSGEGFAGSAYRGNHCRDAIVSEKRKRQHVPTLYAHPRTGLL
jgi:hypothetical protein